MLQKILAKIFPAVRDKLLKRAQEPLLLAIINALPPSYEYLCIENRYANFVRLHEWEVDAKFQYISKFYLHNSLKKCYHSGRNIKLSNIQIYSSRQEKFVEIQLLIKHGMLLGISSANQVYVANEFDLSQIKTNQIIASTFELTEEERYYETLSEKDQLRIDFFEFGEVELDGECYFTIRDLEDGNHLIIDRKQRVYSYIHDDRPPLKRFEKSLDQVLTELPLEIDQVDDSSFDITD